MSDNLPNNDQDEARKLELSFFARRKKQGVEAKVIVRLTDADDSEIDELDHDIEELTDKDC